VPQFISWYIEHSGYLLAPCITAHLIVIFITIFQFVWHDVSLEENVDLTMSVIRAVRSMRADYQLTKLKTDCKLKYIFQDYICTAAKHYWIHYIHRQWISLG